MRHLILNYWSPVNCRGRKMAHSRALLVSVGDHVIPHHLNPSLLLVYLWMVLTQATFLVHPLSFFLLFSVRHSGGQKSFPDSLHILLMSDSVMSDFYNTVSFYFCASGRFVAFLGSRYTKPGL